MAYGDTHGERIKKLLTNPQKEIRHVWPFMKSRLIPLRRSFLETIGIYSESKPYSDHEALLKYVNKKSGFFVQCGGSDGNSNDPTYYLEKALGWRGIIAEPLPIYKRCQKFRSHSEVFNVAIGAPEDAGKDFEFVDVHGMSHVKGSIENEKEWIRIGETTQNIKAKTIRVPMRTVQEIIDEYFKKHDKRTIDLFVADVEGYELNVIKGLDFKKNRPTYLLLEIYGADKLLAIENFLKKLGYTVKEKFSHNDYLFG